MHTLGGPKHYKRPIPETLFVGLVADVFGLKKVLVADVFGLFLLLVAEVLGLKSSLVADVFGSKQSVVAEVSWVRTSVVAEVSVVPTNVVAEVLGGSHECCGRGFGWFRRRVWHKVGGENVFFYLPDLKLNV